GIHGEGGRNDERFVPGIEIRGAEKMNRFVDSVSEQNLPRIESEKGGDFFFNRLALRIPRQQFGNERAQRGQNAWRTSHGALVEIETQSGSPGQRRPISMQMFHRSASFKHGST